MNIDNYLGMALNSDMNGAMAAGSRQSAASGAEAGLGGSLFQQLISRMLAVKNEITAAAEANTAGLVPDASGGTDPMLSDLLLAEGNQARLRFRNAEMAIGDMTEAGGPTGETTEESGGAMEAQQSVMAGLTAALPEPKMEKAYWDVVNILPNWTTPAGAVPADAVSEHRLHLPDNRIPDGRTVLTSVIACSPNGQEGKPAMAENTIMEPGKTIQAAEGSIVYPTVSGDKDFLQTAGYVPLDGLAEKRGAAKGESGSACSSGAASNAISSSNLPLETAPDYADRTKQEREPAPFDSEGHGSLSIVQGAAAGETAEPVKAAQAADANEPYSQIRNEILLKLEQKGPTEFKMQLEPEDLGQIDIKLKLSDGKLVIDILAASSKTQALLTSQVDRLIAGMGLQNVQVESVQVSQQTNSQTQDSSQSQGSAMNAAMDFSQRKQQEQYRQQFDGSSSINGIFDLSQAELKTNGAGINEPIRYDTHRMNYTV